MPSPSKQELSPEGIAAARAEEHRASRAEMYKEQAKKEGGWADELFEGWEGGSTEGLVAFIAKGNQVAVKFQGKIRQKIARRQVNEKRAEQARLDAEAKAQRDADDEAARIAHEAMIADLLAKVKLVGYWGAVGLAGATLALIALTILMESPLGLLLRCFGFYPLPLTCAWSGANAVAAQNAATNHWRQPIKCCDYQVLTLTIPRGAEFHDLVGVQWWQHGQRFASYQRLQHKSRVLGGSLQLQFNMPWDLVGPGGCYPKDYRSCQYGSIPYVEMAAVQVHCPAADQWISQHEGPALLEEIEAEFGIDDADKSGAVKPADPSAQCHGQVEWSWGPATFTMPRDAHGMMGSHNVIYLASFPPEFSNPAPAYLPIHTPSRFASQLDGKPGPAADEPTEQYPVPLPNVLAGGQPASAHTREPTARGTSHAGLEPGAAACLVVAAVAAVAVASRRSRPALL